MKLFMISFVAFLERIERRTKLVDRVNNSDYKTHTVESLASRDEARYLLQPTMELPSPSPSSPEELHFAIAD